MQVYDKPSLGAVPEMCRVQDALKFTDTARRIRNITSSGMVCSATTDERFSTVPLIDAI